jgi:stage V sporulation protein AC
MIMAFIVGGLICDAGQLILNLIKKFGFDQVAAGDITTIIVIFIGALLTGLGLYDYLGKFAGAGSIIPITGFANSIVSPAMEFKSEGYIFGVGARMFNVAGPVIVYGLITSTIFGIIYYLLGL